MINCDQSRPFKGSSRTVVLSTTSSICEVARSTVGAVSRTSTCSVGLPTFRVKLTETFAPTAKVTFSAPLLEKPCATTVTVYTAGCKSAAA